MSQILQDSLNGEESDVVFAQFHSLVPLGKLTNQVCWTAQYCIAVCKFPLPRSLALELVLSQVKVMLE